MRTRGGEGSSPYLRYIVIVGHKIERVNVIDNKKIILEYMDVYAIIYMYIRVLKYGRPVKWVLNYY